MGKEPFVKCPTIDSNLARPKSPSGFINLPVSVDLLLAAVALAALIYVPWIGTKSALLFLLTGLGLMAMRPARSANEFVSAWFLFVLPIYCTATALWSQYPGLSFRFGIQLTITVAITIAVAKRLPPRIFVWLLFFLLSVAMLASLTLGQVRSDTGDWLGIYGSKNALAGAAAIYTVVCIGLVLDARSANLWRLVAFVGLAFGGLLLFKANSTGALLIVFPVFAIQLALVFLPRISGLTHYTLAATMALLLALSALLIQANADVLFSQFLDVTGKDITLTGRTDLWRVAISVIAERPLFGVGYQAFWVQGYAPAEELWYMFGIKGRSGFHFHNTYLSNAVEIGIVGVALQMFVLFGAAFLTGKWAHQTRCAEASIMFALVMMVIMISLIEVPVFFQFSPRTLIIFSAFVYGVRARREMG